MPDIAYSQTPLNTTEVAGDAPVTTALLTKLGGAINFELATKLRFVEFNTVGSHSWTPGDFTDFVFLLGCGGGGSGGNGAGGSGGVGNGGSGAGGYGSELTFSFAKVTPNIPIPIVVGAGGVGGAGGNTTFNSSFTFSGAAKGNNAVLNVGGAAGTDSFGPRLCLRTGGGAGGTSGGAALSGNDSRSFSGGAAGSTILTVTSSGGGGGGAGFGGGGGIGGAGISSGSAGLPGLSAASTSYGAGGGGGGGGRNIGPGGSGGAGAGGILFVLYYDTP